MFRFLNVAFRFMILALLLCAVGCGKMPRAGEYMILEEPPALVIPEEKGVVCFIRKWRYLSGGVALLILEKETEIGAVSNGSYFFHEASEGRHTYYADTGTEGFITVDVRKGKVHYIVSEIAGELGGPRLIFYEVPEEIAMRLFKNEDLDYIRRRTPEELAKWQEKRKK